MSSMDRTPRMNTAPAAAAWTGSHRAIVSCIALLGALTSELVTASSITNLWRCHRLANTFIGPRMDRPLRSCIGDLG